MGGKCLWTLNPRLVHMYQVDCCEPQAHVVQLLQMWQELVWECCQRKSPYSWVNGILMKFVKATRAEASVDMAPFSLPPYMSTQFGSVLLWHQASPIWFWSTLSWTLGFWIFLQNGWHTVQLYSAPWTRTKPDAQSPTDNPEVLWALPSPSGRILRAGPESLSATGTGCGLRNSLLWHSLQRPHIQ